MNLCMLNGLNFAHYVMRMDDERKENPDGNSCRSRSEEGAQESCQLAKEYSEHFVALKVKWSFV